jgi:acetoin utilization deacetylase AcuC-like enzyme
MLKYELLPQQLYTKEPLTIWFFQPEICDLNHVLAIHKQEYVDDLLNLTLNQKQHEKLIFQNL